jgi:AraC family transcriptional regulator, transcriptional activator of pobA
MSTIPTFQTVTELSEAAKVFISAPMKEVLVFRFEETVTTIREVMPPYRANFFLINYFRGNAGFQSINDQTLEQGPWEAYVALMHPGQVISFRRTNWQGYGLHFEPDFGSIGYQQANFTRDFPFFQPNAPYFLPITGAQVLRIESVYEQLYAEYSRPEGPEASLIQSYIFVLLFELRRLYQQYRTGPSVPPPNSRYWELTYRFEQLAREHFREVRSPGQYADWLNITPKYLSEVLMQTQGKPALALLHERVLQEAKNLLRYSNMPVAEIAYQLHFEEPTYFGRFFKKLTGQTPLQYRMQHP